MFEVISSVPDIFNTAIYTVARQAFNEFTERAGIAGYFKNNINYNSLGTSVSGSNDIGGLPLMQQNRADIAIQYNFGLLEQHYEVGKTSDEYQQSLSHLNHANYKVIFTEPLDRISIIEYDRPLTITLSCVLFLNDLVSATDVQQRLQSIFTNGVITHDIMYSYFLPPNVYVRLYELYKFAGNDPQDFMAHIAKFSGDRIMKTVNRHDNSDSALSVKKTKTGIVSSIEPIQGTPTPVGNENSPDMYEMSLSINTQLSMSNLIGISYPIVIDNKLVPREYITLKDTHIFTPPNTTHPYFSVDKYINLLKDEMTVPEKPVHIPWYDKWTPPVIKIMHKYKPFFISVVLLDNIADDNAFTDIDLDGDLGGVTLIPSVVNAIRDQGDSSLYLIENINISLYRNDIMVEPSTLEFVNGTTLRIHNRNTNGVYRLVISATDVILGSLREIRIINADIIAKT